jgi:putative membrane protein
MKELWVSRLAAASLVGVQALAQTPRESGTRRDTATEASQPEQTSPQDSTSALSSADRKFIQEAAEGGVTDVAAGKLAQGKGQSHQVKNIGEVPVKDHSKADEKLKQLATDNGVDLPEVVGNKKQNALSKLEKASGDDFDRKFLSQREKVHRQDIARLEHVANNPGPTRSNSSRTEHCRLCANISS